MSPATTTTRTAPSGRSATSAPRVVIVTRASEYEWLIRRHATAAQARFFLEQRGESIEVVLARHVRQEEAVAAVAATIPSDWRRARVRREDLDRFLFEPADVVVAVGQDGLVANMAKYLDGQLVVGINPDPDTYEGVLVPHAERDARELLHVAVEGSGSVDERVMVRAALDDGQTLLALNEVFVGHRTHQSARYDIDFDGASERHSSSGLIVATGTGSTGWARSIARSRRCALTLPAPGEPRLVFFVREAWPSVATGADLVEGLVDGTHELAVTSRMEENGVIFGDGIEADRIEFGWGRRLTISTARQRLRLLR